jgi:phage gpG-like protein
MFFKVTRNDVSPSLAKLASTAKNPLPVYRAMGTTFKSITEGTFNSVGASYRPAPWKPKRDGTPSILQSRNPVLSKSFHLEVTSTFAKLSNPMLYAGVHQFGATITPKNAKALRFQSGGKWFTVKKVVIPARPFFPVIDGKLTPAAEDKIRRAGERAIARQAGGTTV